MQEKSKNNGTESNSEAVEKDQSTLDQSKSSQGKDLVNEWEQFSQAINTPKEKFNIDQT